MFNWLQNIREVFIAESLSKCMLILFFSTLAVTSFARSGELCENSEGSRIKWIGEYPSNVKQSAKKGVFKRLGEFVLGKKTQLMVKPMAIVAENPSSFFVLDQWSRCLISVEDQKAVKPRAFNKTSIEFPSMVDVCALPTGEFLFTDSSTGNIYILGENKKKIRVFNEDVKLQQPTGIAYSKVKKEIWVLDTRAHKISVFDRKGKLLREIGKRGIGLGEFNFPTHIWIDEEGSVYIIDSMNFRVQILDQEGIPQSVFGKMGDGTGSFARQKGIATDSKHNIYVVDALFNTVQIFDQKGVFLYNFGSPGNGKGEFLLPTGIHIDEQDYIYVADSYNSRVQIFQLIKEEGDR